MIEDMKATESRGQAGEALFLFGTLEIGGSETKFVRLANRLYADGWPVQIAYLREPEPLLAEVESVPCIHLRQKGRLSLRAFRNLHRFIGEQRVRTVVNVNLYPTIYSQLLKQTGSGASFKNVVSINTSELLSKRDRMFMHIYAPLLRRADHIVFGALSQSKDWISKFGLHGASTSVIHNGVDGDIFSRRFCECNGFVSRADLGIPPGEFVIVCVSQLRPEKGHANLLHALSQVKKKMGFSPYLVLVGDGAERDRITALAANLDLAERVKLVGAVGDVRPYLCTADLFVLPSTAVETFSNAALEACSMGVPAVLSDLGGAREMFPEESPGIVYERDDVNGLVEILAGKIKAGPISDTERTEVRNDILQRFSTDKMDKLWIETIWRSEFSSAAGKG